MTRLTLLLLGTLLAVPTLALETERVSDRELEDVIKSLDKSTRDFARGLDRDVRTAIVRSPSGEIDMKRFLDDFEDNVERIDDRYRRDYAASAEALAVLRQGNDLKEFMARHPGIKGEAEWQLLDADLARLANAYTAQWPIDPASPEVRRIGDQEFYAALESIERGVRDVRRSVEKSSPDMTESGQATAAELVRECELAEDLIKPLHSKLKDSEPALAEARILLDRAAVIDSRIGQIPVDERTREKWTATRNAFGKFAQGFGLVWPPVE